MKSYLYVLFLLLFQIASYGQLISGIDQSQVKFSDFIKGIGPGAILIIGESHARSGFENRDQKTQQLIIQSLVGKGLRVNVGMEFVPYTKQLVLNDFLSGGITREKFISDSGWGRSPLQDYEPQMFLPLQSGGHSFGLNLDRSISKKIFKNGLASLTQKEREQLPEDFTLGDEQYRKRFIEAMGGHGDPKFLENAFIAQSSWDDTMAESILTRTPQDEVLVVIVGYFHVRFGGGLVDRILARLKSDRPVVSLIQTENLQLSNQQRLELSQVHEEYGVIGTYVW